MDRAWIFSISDSGPGIKEDFLPRVFDRFSQQDASKTREHGGMGLGLAIVRHLIELHGGDVAVSMTEGHGATFIVRLPAEATDRPPMSAPAQKERPRLRGVHVLVVDDDADARDIVEGMLQDHGAVVLVAKNAIEGYECIARGRPDVLICDLGMPGEDGLGFIMRLRKDSDAGIAATPAIAVTAYARPQDEQRSLQAGFDAHLSKPVSADALIAAVQRLAGSERERPQSSAR